MIYTIGNTKVYEKLLKEKPNSLFKLERGIHEGKFYEGGIIFETFEDATKHLKDKKLNNYSVYGVLADLEKDTIPYKKYGKNAHALITPSLIKKPYFQLM